MAAASLKKKVKSVLRAAHEEYLNRVASGEDPDTVLNELVSSTLAQICSLYN